MRLPCQSTPSVKRTSLWCAVESSSLTDGLLQWYSTGSYPTFAGASPSMSRYCLDGYPQPGYTQPTLWDPTYAMSPGMYDKTTGAMQHLAIDDQSYGADLSPLYSSRASCHATTWSSASDASSCAGSASTAAAAAGAGVVLTEQRKVVLANLPSKMLDDAGVRSVLASAVGAKAVSRVQKIEFSRSTGGSKRNKPHGHVFVVFATARTAWDVVAALNGFKVWGHTVRAHLAKEGVAVGGEEDTFLAAESSPTAAAGTGGTGAYEGDGAEAPGGSTRPCPPAAKSKGKQAHREKDRKEKSSASASYSFSSKSKDKDKGRDRDQPSSVIVANGSGGQFSQHRSKHRDDSKRHRS